MKVFFQPTMEVGIAALPAGRQQPVSESPACRLFAVIREVRVAAIAVFGL
jgi:hypothetical protein